MQYGYFDDEEKEYVITNPATPASWSNYLGSALYGAIITNNAGGYSFYKSAAQGRFMRFRTNAIPMDQPGRYIYIHDRDSKNYMAYRHCTWAYYSAIHYIPGIRPDYEGLTIDPCIPKDWKEISIKRIFRGKTLDITIINPNNSEKGVERMEVNNTIITGNLIPEGMLNEYNNVLVYFK